MNKTTKKILYLALTAGILWYFVLTPINLQDPFFYSYIIFFVFLGSFYAFKQPQPTGKSMLVIRPHKKVLKGLGIVILILIGINIAYSPLFQSKAYANRITIKDGTFNEDVPEADLSNLTIVDKESSIRLGDRVLGNIPEYVSQFSVSDEYTTVTCNNHLYRVTPLEYNDFIKYETNKKEGTPGYIMVDSTTGEASLVRVDHGMHYLHSAYFNHDLRRHLVLSYPTKVFGPSHFEIDEDYQPFYITPSYSMHGIGLRKDVKDIIVTNVSTGENTVYDVNEVPSWIDHVYPSELLVDQVDCALKYQNGFFNTLFGQRNVRQLTPAFEINDINYVGYQYVSIKDDVCIYSGVTSATSDESNLGFIISNLRTKETEYYPCSGAEEYSAMASAKGLVQEKHYDATFPLLINLKGKPTYLVTLKDAAGLVKMYAFVDPSDYQQVYAGDSKDGVQNVANDYLKMLGRVDTYNDPTKMYPNANGTISILRSIVDDGNTYYYFMLEHDATSYIIKATQAPFMEVNDYVDFSFDEANENMVVKVEQLKKQNKEN